MHFSYFFLFCFILLVQLSSANTLHVGIGQPYPNFEDAAAEALPGDTILVHEGIFDGGLFINELQGTSDAWIYILAASDEVIYQGGSNAWQFTDGAYLLIRGFTFQQQTGNGLNFDDGGTYDSPTHHIIFEDCTFRDMSASGNNDLLKLSGLDSFEIRNCFFLNGATGGSGIDMVGCHDGLITNCRFENMGSNAIQAKGGTHRITIEANFFKNAGQRSVNLGGSTGLQFFRPIDAPYEAAELKVYSNIFVGSVAPVAFVGCINTEVINNTIYLPDKWVIRILQETVDTTRFPPCGYNTFRNNLIVINNLVTVECNIGPNTAPETFTFSNNLWFHSENPNWPGPNLPVTDQDNITGEDPLLVDPENENFYLLSGSPALHTGFNVMNPVLNYNRVPFIQPRSIGAIDGIFFGIQSFNEHIISLNIWPQPADQDIIIELNELLQNPVLVNLISLDGKSSYPLHFIQLDDYHITSSIPSNLSGMFILVIQSGTKKGSAKVVID